MRMPVANALKRVRDEGRRTWARLAAVGDQTHASWACAAAEPRLLLVANDSHRQLLPDAQLVLAGVADRGVFDMTLHVGADGLETATTARAVAVARSEWIVWPVMRQGRLRAYAVSYDERTDMDGLSAGGAFGLVE